MPTLGNELVTTGEPGIKIADPSAVVDLLKRATECHRQNRRVLFFCSCEDLDNKTCHRNVVAELVLREAERQGRQIEIVEWPGSEPTYTTLDVTPEILKKVGRAFRWTRAIISKNSRACHGALS
jgi:hypothetical protein